MQNRQRKSSEIITTQALQRQSNKICILLCRPVDIRSQSFVLFTKYHRGDQIKEDKCMLALMTDMRNAYRIFAGKTA
jgi:hypothetical protein